MQISLGSSATIANVREVHKALLDAFETGEDLTIDAGQLADADLTLVQLLEAARTHAASKGTAIALTGADSNPALASVLGRNGFLTRPGKAERDFWMLEEAGQ